MDNASARVIEPSYNNTELDKSLVFGIAWTSGMKWFGQLLSWASTIVVARLLVPADFGLIGMASVYFGLVMLLTECGLGATIVIKRELTVNQLAQLNTLSVLIGLTALAVSVAGAKPVAHFFGAPSLRWVVVVMSVACVITAFQTVPSAVMQKEFQFRSLAIFEGCQSLVAAVSTVVLAFLGFGYWALVLGNLTGISVLITLLLTKHSQHFAWPRTQEIKECLTISSHIWVSRLAWYLQSNADFLIAGRMLGQWALGIYTIGWDLASAPVDKVSALTARVTPALFTAVSSDSAALRRYLLMLTEGLALITVPMSWGLAIVADEFVLLVLGDKWQASTGPLRILAILAALRCVVGFLPQILNATGASRLSMYNGITGGILLPVGFYLGSRWGIVGIAMAWLITYPFLVFPLYWWVFRRIQMGTTQYLRVLWPTLSASAVMVASVAILKLFLPSAWELALRFFLEVVVGIVVYLAIIGSLHRERVSTITRFLRDLRTTPQPCTITGR